MVRTKTKIAMVLVLAIATIGATVATLGTGIAHASNPEVQPEGGGFWSGATNANPEVQPLGSGDWSG